MALVVSLTIVLVVILFISVYCYVIRNFDYWRKRRIPYIEPTPFFGNIGSVFRCKESIGQCIATLHKQTNEPFVGIFTVDCPALLIRDLELMRHILIKDFNSFTDRNFAPDPEIEPLASHGLFCLTGDKWRNLRGKLTSAFSISRIKNMFYLVEQCAEPMNKILTKHAENNEPLDVKDFMARYTTDVISTCVFGVTGNAINDPNWDFYHIGRSVFKTSPLDSVKSGLLIFAPWFVKLFGIRMINDSIYDAIRKSIWTAIDLRQKNNIIRNDFIDLLLQIREKSLAEDRRNDESVLFLDGDALVGQAFVFLLGGYETSSTTMSLALYEMALNPVIQQKVRREIDRVLAKHNNTMSYEAVHEMTYLNQVVSETLRKYPALPFLDRNCVKDYIIPGTNVKIDCGTKVFISLLSLHHDPEIFPNPEQFDPDRFTEENISKRHKFAYLPFGNGPRICIGMRFGLLQTKVGLIYLLKNFEIEPLLETMKPIEFTSTNITLAIKHPLKLRIKKRTD